MASKEMKKESKGKKKKDEKMGGKMANKVLEGERREKKKLEKGRK